MLIATGFWRVISWIATFGVFVAGIFTGTNYGDFTAKYKKNVESVSFYENDFDTAVPQTDIYGLISDHFSSELPEGKTVKKAIVIGYDGCRADNLVMCKDGGATKMLLADGGHAALSYCGGVNYPRINTQDTSTAPGWCSMLTGQWADVTGVTENDIPKSLDNPTLLLSLVENNTIKSSSFCVSWSGHFTDSDSTYINEKTYAENNGLRVSYKKADDDNGTKANVINDINSAECSDFIFSIFEYCDHVGHDTGFSMGNEEIPTIFQENETTAADIIKAIKARSTYEQEDWLIILTSDHGGYNTWHGGPTMQERYTFIVCNKDFLK